MLKVLEVNNVDLLGRTFNGYNMINELTDEDMSVKQVVIEKQSFCENVIKILNDKEMLVCDKLKSFEEKLSIHNLLSITTPTLKHMREYKEADIIHFHMFHNTKLSIPSLMDISREKHVVLTLHDPWFLTGRCVHFYDCDKWKIGCNNCKHLDNLFPFTKDNCNNMWNIKKEVFHNSNIDIVVSSKWMYDNVKSSPIFGENVRLHLIPFGINLDKYKNYNKKAELKEKFGFDKDDVVLFLRAQMEFKGTEYILEALEKLKTNKKIGILTCNEIGLFNGMKDKYKVVDLGNINEDEVIDAMNACDIFLMPSKGESFGMMTVEAMACEKPVIIFNNTALPSVTFAPECGYLVEDRNSFELSKAIKKLVDDDKERIKRGKLGRKYCEEYYDYDNYNSKLKKLYYEISKVKLKRINSYNIDESDYELYLNAITKYLEKDIIDEIDYSNPKYLYAINKVNDEIYFRVCDCSLKLKISFIKKIKNILKKNKIVNSLYFKVKSFVQKSKKKR